MPDGFVISAAMLAVVVALFAATRPTRYEVKHTIRIEKSPDTVFALVNSLKNWEKWSPWIRKDQKMSKAYHGEDGQPGSSFEWKSQVMQIGSGVIRLLESEAPSRAKFELCFSRPFHTLEAVEFALSPSNDNATDLVWTMTGHNRLILRLGSMFGDMVEKIVGADFEAGLAEIKRVAEEG